MVRRKTMITMGSPYFVWINATQCGVCDPPPLLRAQSAGGLHAALVGAAHAASKLQWGGFEHRRKVQNQRPAARAGAM
jgi:hypothetical protein